jgi:DNA-binding protein H-NS
MQSFEQIQAQIVDLQKQADAMRKQAMSAAIKEIKRLVNLYSLGYAELGISTTGKAAPKSAPTKAAKAATKTAKAPRAKKPSADNRAAVAPKFRDSETGQTWSGRGKPPTWLAAKIAAGASKDSFLI